MIANPALPVGTREHEELSPRDRPAGEGRGGEGGRRLAAAGARECACSGMRMKPSDVRRAAGAAAPEPPAEVLAGRDALECRRRSAGTAP